MNADSDDWYLSKSWRVVSNDRGYIVCHAMELLYSNHHELIKEGLTWDEAVMFRKSIEKLKGG